MPADVIPIGQSVRLISVYSLSRELGLNPDTVRQILDQMAIPTVEFADGLVYFDLWTLECVLRLTLMPRSPGWPPKQVPSHPSAGISLINRLMTQIGRYYSKRTEEALKRRCQRLGQELLRRVRSLEKAAAVQSDCNK